jgi:hypothetical protein
MISFNSYSGGVRVPIVRLTNIGIICLIGVLPYYNKINTVLVSTQLFQLVITISSSKDRYHPNKPSNYFCC